MQTTFALAALAAVAFAAPAPQTPSSIQTPPAAPAGCAASFNGKFQIAAVNVTSSGKRSIEARQSTSCDAEGSLTLTLKDTILLDGLGRIGAIVANRQFQFDNPPQAGTIYAAGFSACANNTLAIGGSAIFYQCLSGSFYNLYDQSFAVHCNPVYLQIQPCAAGGSGSSPGGVGQIGDGQVTATNQGAVTQIGDGQVQAPTGKPVISQIGDGQIQAPTGKPAPITQIGDGQVQAPTGKPAPITQIGDGQIQAPTGKPAPPITQIGDGQIQAPKPTAPVISQIADGQIQAPKASAPVISQISDGQIQAPKPTAPVVSQIADGQIQAPKPSMTTAKAPVVSQIADGQIQAPTNVTTNTTKPTTVPFLGAASTVSSSLHSTIAVVGLGLLSFMLL